MKRAGERKQTLSVFVASTFEDLKEHRRAVRDALSQLEIVVRGMEYFGSKPRKPVEECLDAVRSCNIYVGIFGMRYGSIPEGYDKSLTHLEYDEAQRCKLPSLIYIIDEKAPILAKDVETGRGAKALRSLKKSLARQHVVSTFTSPEDLARRVLHDVPDVLDNIATQMEGELSHSKDATLSNAPGDKTHEANLMWPDQLQEQPIAFKGMWRGKFDNLSKSKRKTDYEIVHIREQDELNRISGEFYDEKHPNIIFTFKGVYKMSFLMVVYKVPSGQNVMEDGSCFLKLQRDGSFKGYYANFEDCGKCELWRIE